MTLHDDLAQVFCLIIMTSVYFRSAKQSAKREWWHSADDTHAIIYERDRLQFSLVVDRWKIQRSLPRIHRDEKLSITFLVHDLNDVPRIPRWFPSSQRVHQRELVWQSVGCDVPGKELEGKLELSLSISYNERKLYRKIIINRVKEIFSDTFDLLSE